MGRWTQPTNFDLLPPAKGAFMLFRQPRVFSWAQWPHVPPMCARIHGNGASAPSATASRYELIVLPAADSSFSRSTSISRALQRTIDGNKQPGVVLVHQDEPARRERAAFPRQRRYPAAVDGEHAFMGEKPLPASPHGSALSGGKPVFFVTMA